MVEANPNQQNNAARTFTPCQDTVKELEGQLSNQVESNKQLAPEQAVTGEIDAYFSCTICLMVVEDPKECQECNQLCCGACIQEWTQRNNTCVNCRAAINLGKNVNRFVMQSLNATEFQCDKCPQTFKYEQRKSHWASCGQSIACKIEACARGQASFASLDELRAHWANECTGIEMKCSVCYTRLVRDQIAAHTCDQALIALVRQLEARVKELEEENAKLKAQPQIQRPQPGVHHAPSTNQSCSAGHAMTYKTQPFPRTVHGQEQPGISLNCDICRNRITPSIGYFRCDSRGCDYDICARCGMRNAPVRPGPVPMPRLMPRIPVQNAAHPLKCLAGHAVVFYPTGRFKQRRNGATGQVLIYQGDQLICNGCKQGFSIASRGGSYSCQQQCDFDLCTKCCRCANGHQLQIQVQNPYTHTSATAAPRCDRCRNMIPQSVYSTGFARCATCEYDVCRTCIPRPS